MSAGDSLALIREASVADVPGIAQSLARAFYDDPVWRWFMPDDATRAQRLALMFATLVRQVYLRRGNDCYTTDANQGAALWLPPGRAKLSPMDFVRSAPGFTRAIGPRHLLRARRGLAGIEKVHPAEPHYYLAIVGVAPEHQGRGIGTALFAPVLDKCDRERIPAYLEATTVDSRRCYERIGFRPRAEHRLAGDGPRFWPMWREPGAPPQTRTYVQLGH